MKATDIFKNKKFIECLKYNTYDDKDNYIKIFDDNNEIIEENVKKVTKIDCPGYWITNIDDISIFINLEKLYLNYNNIKELPKEIGNLKNLKELYLGNNQIQKLQKEIFQLENLKELYLVDNWIKEIPKEIWNLKNLEELYLNNNNLQWLPIEILKLSKLKWLSLKKAFDLDNLKLKPEELFYILEQLKEKNLFSNLSLDYLEEEVYPILAEKIKKKYKITDLKQIKDNLNLDNLNF